MIQRDILLNEVSKIQTFNAIAGHCDYDVDLQQGKYLVDAKSIMGIFSLNMEKPVRIILHTDDEAELKQFALYLKK